MQKMLFLVEHLYITLVKLFKQLYSSLLRLLDVNIILGRVILNFSFMVNYPHHKNVSEFMA